MLFRRLTTINECVNPNPYLEASALSLFFKDLKGSFTFYEDGIGRLQSYDGNRKHLIFLSFEAIEKYCMENMIDYYYGEDPNTGMDTLTVCKKEP